MGDAMKKGDEMGKNASKPMAMYRRPADFPIALVPPVNPTDAPFWASPGKGKTKRFGGRAGRRDHVKKAYVSLKPGQELNFSGEAA